MSFLDRFAACSAPALDDFVPFVVAGKTVGLVGPDFGKALRDFPDTFAVGNGAIVLDPGLDTFEVRTEAVEQVLRKLAERGCRSGVA